MNKYTISYTDTVNVGERRSYVIYAHSRKDAIRREGYSTKEIVKSNVVVRKSLVE